MMARIGAITEKQPFTAHAQGTRWGAVEPMIEIPRGKGAPIRTPAGMMMQKERTVRIISDWPLIAPMLPGNRRL